MLEDPKVTKMERDGTLYGHRGFDMRTKCRCGSTATREHKGIPVCMFCLIKLEGEKK